MFSNHQLAWWPPCYTLTGGVAIRNPLPDCTWLASQLTTPYPMECCCQSSVPACHQDHPGSRRGSERCHRWSTRQLGWEDGWGHGHWCWSGSPSHSRPAARSSSWAAAIPQRSAGWAPPTWEPATVKVGKGRQHTWLQTKKMERIKSSSSTGAIGHQWVHWLLKSQELSKKQIHTIILSNSLYEQLWMLQLLLQSEYASCMT